VGRRAGPAFEPILQDLSRSLGVGVQTMKRSFLHLSVLALCLVPTAALAHPDIGNASGFTRGFMHPLSGLDHQLSMI
jgi:hydrogenase/urease accessory protein HupE